MVGPGPGALQAQGGAAGVEGQPGGGVQQSVAQCLGLAAGEFAVECQALCVGDEVLGCQGDLQPHLVVVEVAEGEVLQAGLLGGTDPILGARPRSVQALKLDRVAIEVGQRGQEAMAVVVGERQLRAGVRALAADNHTAIGWAMR